MHKNLHRLLILSLCLSLIPTSTRFSFYEYKYANFKYLTGNSMIDFKNESRFPSSEALKYLANHPDKRVFTFRQSDLLTSRESNWIDNFDPRAKAFLEAESVKELFELLKKNKISFVLVPNYSWPTMYNSYFQELLGDPRYSTPLIETIDFDQTIDQYQLYKIKEENISTFCQQTNVLTEEFYAPTESPQVRLFYSVLGVPGNIQSTLSKIDVEKRKNFTDFTKDEKSILRSLNRSVSWYDKSSPTTNSKRLIIRVKLKSGSLVSLKAQGVSTRFDSLNLPMFSRIVNVGEDLDTQGDIGIVTQILKAEKVEEVKLFLSTTGGVDLLKGDIDLEVCTVKVWDQQYENPLQEQNQFRLGDPTLIRINLFNCDLNEICKIPVSNKSSGDSRLHSFRDLLKDLYQSTEKLYSPFEVVSTQMQKFFNYVPGDLEKYSFECLEVCPTEGLIYAHWTNSHGFRNQIIISYVAEDSAQKLNVFLPNLRIFKDVEIGFRNAEVETDKSTVYELRRHVS